MGSGPPRLARRLAPAVLAAGLAGCGSHAPAHHGAAPIPVLPFSDDPSAPLEYVDRGPVKAPSSPIAQHDVSFRSSGRTVEGYLLLPPGARRRPAVLFLHGSGGDRGQLVPEARWLAARGVVTMTITAPSESVTTTPRTGTALLAQARSITVRDVVAAKRAVDVLASLPEVDPTRIGYVGWSAGALTGIYVGASDPRVKALVLLSAGADRLSAFVSHAPVALRPRVRAVLGSVDPIRYMLRVRPGSVLLEEGRDDEVVPREALLNVVHAAPKGTVVRWLATRHALDVAAWQEGFDWLARKLPIAGPRVAGAPTTGRLALP